eukprot:1156263-Pelagomonas_calceolata.AAC.2
MELDVLWHKGLAGLLVTLLVLSPPPLRESPIISPFSLTYLNTKDRSEAVFIIHLIPISLVDSLWSQGAQSEVYRRQLQAALPDPIKSANNAFPDTYTAKSSLIRSGYRPPCPRSAALVYCGYCNVTLP